MANDLCYLPRHVNIRVFVHPCDLSPSSSKAQERACVLQDKREENEEGTK